MSEYEGVLPERVVKILQKQLAELHRSPEEFLLCEADDLRTWHFLIYGLPKPFDGFYGFTLTVSNDYPFKPPRLMFRTQTGVYELNTPICLSIGEFHVNGKSSDGALGWRPAIGMAGFAREVVNSMISGIDHGIGILQHQSVETQAAIAKKSREYVQKLREFSNLLAEADRLLASSASASATSASTSATSASSAAPASTSATSASTSVTSASTPAPAAQSALTPAPASAARAAEVVAESPADLPGLSDLLEELGLENLDDLDEMLLANKDD